MAIEELTAVIPPPKKPRHPDSEEVWKAVQDKLKIKLPDDLRDLGRVYGSGGFIDGEIYFTSPFSPTYVSFVQDGAANASHYKEWEDDFPFDPYPLMPGLLPWGSCANGGRYYYLTEGSPENWPLVLIPHGYVMEYEVRELPLSTFLAKAFSNQIRTDIWRDELDGLNRDFS